MKKVISVVGARPNFIKIAPLYRAFKTHSDKVVHLICHTGQHFDKQMSDVFFEEMELPKPHFFLAAGGGSHAEQTAKIMVGFEKVLLAEQPDLIIVVGDVNSTVACSLVASKLNIPIAHVEAGLRSFDKSMPEEINRIVTDSISDYLFVTEQSAVENLRQSGVPDSKIFFVGNVMIDSLVNCLPSIKKSGIHDELELSGKDYILSTFHRPSNVDKRQDLMKLVAFLNQLATFSKVVFPAHPRTMRSLEYCNLLPSKESVILIEPLGYHDFMSLVTNAKLVITDSGGIQEETTYLNIPCITVRDTTERPVTVTKGTNQIAGADFSKALELAKKILHGEIKQGEIPELWDGQAADRIVKILMTQLR